MHDLKRKLFAHPYHIHIHNQTHNFLCLDKSLSSLQGHNNQWGRKRATKKEEEGEKKVGRVEKYVNHAKSPNNP